jgi:transposase
VSLVERGWADQNDVARIFEVTARTLRRYQRRYEDEGMVGLGRGPGYPSGRPRGVSGERLLRRLKDEGHSNRIIAHRLGISEKAVRKRLRRLGWKPVASAPEQQSFPLGAPPGADPNLSASGDASLAAPLEPASATPSGADPNLSASSTAPRDAVPATPVSADTDPMDRRFDRFLAHMGALDDAAPLFVSATRVPNAGVLLAVPSLVTSGVLDSADKVYGSIGPAFYGLRTTLLTLLFMALWRIKRPEGLPRSQDSCRLPLNG